MEQLKHFSHEHPLILDRDHAQECVNCCGCNKSIHIGDSAYSCSIRTNWSCGNFFLHKTCAELPQKLEYPLHQHHRLTLNSRPQYDNRGCICNVCSVDGWKWFTYQCVSCQFDLCLTRALQEFRFHEVKDRNFQHEAHNHPLTLMPREALFSCDACDTETKDLSYFCTTCLFWIHQSCASAQTILKCEFHEDHPLILAYSLPEQYGSFLQYCSICTNIVQENYWIYYCADCRFFSHIKCATKTKTVEPLILRSSENENIDEPDKPNLVHLPVPNEASLSSLIHRFVKVLSHVDDSSIPADQISHSSHKDHPLVICGNESNTEMKYDEMLCDGCLQPLSVDTFYGCVQCNYFLHGCCAKLPLELEHPSHPEHKLYLDKFNRPLLYFTCDFCKGYCNGMYYCCQSCTFFIDIVCASLPSKINHDSHKHPLKQLKLSDCSEREFKYTGFGFGCQDCGFYLSKNRAIMSVTIRHRWDPHPLLLMYPPVKDHPHEFDCEMCSIYINPNYWFYHCRDCDMSFHIGCFRDDFWSNVKFGATVKIDNLHPHRLTFVQNKKKKATCGSCGTGDIGKWRDVLECAPCKFVICSVVQNCTVGTGGTRGSR